MTGGGVGSGVPWVAALAVLLGVVVGWRRPGWSAPLLLALCGVRPAIGGVAELPTWCLVGLGLARVRHWRGVGALPWPAVAAWLAMPLWVSLSAFWARQSLFVPPELGKWLVLSAAAALAAVPPRAQPAEVLAGALTGLLPTALWTFAERAEWIAPRGDRGMLRARAIIEGGVVRGRALFQHPNRVAELLDQVGLLCAGFAVGGPLRVLGAAGVVAAVAGSWGTGSRAGLGVLAGGALALVAWRAGSARLTRFPAVPVAAAVTVLAAAVAAAWWTHGGLGSRAAIYEFAWSAIAVHPLLGWGGGNYPLVLAAAPPAINRAFFGQHCHSLALQLWIELGIVGVLLAAATFAVPLWLAASRARRGPWPTAGLTIGAMAGIVGLLLHDVVSYFFTQPAHGIVPGVLLGLLVPADAPWPDRHRPAGGDPARENPQG